MKITRREFIKKSAIGIAVIGVATILNIADVSAKPKRTKYLIKVCDGGPCRDKGNKAIVDAIKKKVNIKEDKNISKDGRFTLQISGCLGMCGEGPIVVINDKVYKKVSPESIVKVLAKLKIAV